MDIISILIDYLDIEDIICLYITSKSTQQLLDTREIINRLKNQYKLDNISDYEQSKNNILPSFQQFHKAYDIKYATLRCLKYCSLMECCNMAAKVDNITTLTKTIELGMDRLVFPFIYAAENGSKEVFKYLLSKISDDEKLYHQAISAAVKYGHIDIINMIPDNVNNKIEIAIIKGSLYGKTKLVMKLIEIIDSNYDLRNILNTASKYEHFELVKALLNYGITPHPYDFKFAIRNKNQELINLLWKNDISYYNAGLCAAAYLGDIELIEKFLKLGATDHNSALVSAAEAGNLSMVEMIIKLGATGYNHALEGSCANNHIKIVKFLLDKGAVDQNDQCLYYASKYGYFDIVKLLIDHLHINYTKNSFISALKSAAVSNHIDIVKYFIFYVASDINMNIDSINVLQPASIHGHFDLVKFICQDTGLDYSNINIKDEIKICIEWSITNGHLDIFKYLNELLGENNEIKEINIKYGLNRKDICEIGRIFRY